MKPSGPHENATTMGKAGFGRIKVPAWKHRQSRQVVPTRAQLVEAGRPAEHDQMVADAAQAMAGREAVSRWSPVDKRAGLTD